MSKYLSLLVFLLAAVVRPSVAADGSLPAFTNSLGMPFVKVSGAKVWFCTWLTRVQDYELWLKATGKTAEAPGFKQGPTHPAVNVSWADAKAFCQWLTDKDRAAGKITKGQSYRLPTDAEWSVAVGLNEPAEGTPEA